MRRAMFVVLGTSAFLSSAAALGIGAGSAVPAQDLTRGDYLASITVDVVSRFATRRLTINGDAMQLRWDWSRNCIEVFSPEKKEWETLSYEMGKAAAGYNANIGENMYIDELRSFIDATSGGDSFINSLADDHAVLKILYAVEAADRSGRVQLVKPA